MADSEISGRTAHPTGSLLGDLGQALLEAMPMPACICDTQGLIVTCNAAAKECWGGTMRAGMRGDAFLRTPPSWRHGGDDALPESPLALAQRTDAAVRDIEVTVETAQGDHRWALASVAPLTDRHGATRGFICSFGITQPQDDMEDLFENGAVGLHFVAPDGTILRANRAELELLGYCRDEYVGHNIGEFHADQDVLADILTRLRAGEAIDKHPVRLIARDGQIRHVQITSSGCFRDGSFTHTRCFTIDVTEQKRLADARQEREKLAHQLLQALPMAIYTTDAQGRITFYNEAAVAFAGRRPALGEEWCVSRKLFRSDGTPLPHEQSPMAIAIREARPVHGEEAIAERPDGSRVAFAPFPTPLFDDAGVMVGAVNMLVDITDRKKIERSLQELNDTLEQRVIERTHLAESASLDLRYSERNFALLVGSIVDYAIFMLDPDGIISNWNSGAERIKGYRAEEIVGKHFSCFYTPEDRASGLPANALAVARREGRYSAEGWRVRKDGTRFWASVVLDPIIDHGEVIGFAKVTRDVTERMESEAALIESEGRARGVIDTALDGFVQLDESGRVVEWNPRATAMFGWPREKAMGELLTALIVADEDRARLAASLPPNRLAAATGGNEQIHAIDFEGMKIPVELSISTLASNGGCRTNVFIRDLSEKIFIESQLRQSQKMEAVGQLTGGLAHDFNNLLQGIIGSLDIIQLRVNEGRAEGIGRFVDGALTSAYRAAAMTHRLLAFSRQQPLDPRPVDVNPLMISMEDLIQRTIGEQIKVEFEPAADLWLTLCDANQLESAVLNLSINARDAMPEGGRLTIRSRNVDIDEVKAVRWQDAPAGQYVCIEVTDTGIGMPPEVVERAFDPFFTTKPQGQGTGLGLSMVYGFGRQSNGHCDIRSAPGKGSTIRLYLPRYIAEAGHREEVPAPAPPAAAAGRGEVVLVVEDETVVRQVIVEVLHQLGYGALEAADAEAGLELLRSSEPIALLVSDVGLPGMNGRELADAALGLRPGLRVLLMTGYASEAAMASGFAAPGMELITKPFAVEALARRMREMIELAHR
ncbi:PAS domain S-box protein [Rhodanobacter umsongensis]|uniref:histidine kinase n=1 Tax=Rhodanobacter umsongensis TaxID=633153 RepID=A0ABW0JP76_9GAMM